MTYAHALTIMIAMAFLAAGLPADAQDLLRNPTFEAARDGDGPSSWRFGSYGTDALGLHDPDGGLDGSGAVGIHSRSADERGSWGQVIQLGEGARRHLHLTGWYRTEGIEEREAATVRVTWRREDRENLVIGDTRQRFEPAEEWTRFELLLAAPAEAVAATIDLFNFYRPGIVWWSEVQASPAMASEHPEIRRWAEQVVQLEAGAATDGTNLLLNPSFELDIGKQDTPDFWERGGGGREGYPVPSIASLSEWVNLGYVTDRARTGERSVSVRCLDDRARAAWVTTVPLAPGPWRLEAWQMTEGMAPEPRQGPVARVTALDENGRVILHFYAYGRASEDEWSPVRLQFDAPPGTVSAQVQLRNVWTVGTVYWDDVHLGADVERRAQLEQQHDEDLRLLPEVRETLAQAREQVEQLSERITGAEGDLLLAVLRWGLQDAERAIGAGMGRDAWATLADVLDYCERADEIIDGAQLGPSDPTRDGNPYVAALNDQMESMAQQTHGYPKGEAGYMEIDGAWTFRAIGGNAHVLAWGLLDPRSDLQHDPRLLERVLTHLQAIVDHQMGGSVTPHRDSRDWNIDRFTLGPALDALYQIDRDLPWAILPSKREAWWREMRRMVEYQYDTYGFRYFEHGPEQSRVYPNMDVHYLLIFELAHQLFGDDRYPVERDRFLGFMDEALLPMGAWSYGRMQNEVYQYHRLNTSLLARYYEISGDQHARDILERSRPYYPLVHDPEGMVEHYTDVSWKHSWIGASPAGAEIKAGMFDCAENKRAALNAAQHGHESGIAAVRAVSWWKDIEPAEQRDEWLIYDENTQGPRGQFGRFSFAGSARETLPTGSGRDTFVGCMVSDREASGRPIDAALQVATIEYRLTPDGTPIRRNSRYMSGYERHSVIVADEFASQAVRYLVVPVTMPHEPDGLDWEGSQQWFMSRDRLVGMLTLRTLEDSPAAGVWGRLHFGNDREFEQGPDGMFRYGSLIARIHEHSFEVFEMESAESEPGINGRSTKLMLGDERALSGVEPPWEYPAGEEHFYLIEVLPYWSDLAHGVEAIQEGPIRGFSFAEDGRRVTVLHNRGSEETTFRAAAAGDSVVVHSPPQDIDGPRARIQMLNGHFDWPPDEVRVPPSEIPVADGQFEVVIGGDSHVVVVSEL